MGSDQDGCLKGIDVSAGGLVWIRRRNGSWWPGRILGRDELPAKCLLPPRSGTPIKLLGREDGSMDWYNLEKSKRVKPFRCGEYDECIERARASAVCSKKKPANAGKYVRREDAILHALELEKAHFSNRNQMSSGMNHSVAKTNNCLVIESKNMHTLNKQPGYVARKRSVLDENSAQELSKSVLSFEQPNKPMASDMRYMLKKRWRTPNDSEDDATEGIKRMRDLQEIGLETVSKRKPNIRFHAKEFDELAFADNASLSESNTDNGFSSVCHINGSKDSCSSLKKKRSHVVLSSENLRKKNHHHPQTKVSKGSRIITPSYCHWGAGFTGWSSLLGETQNKLGFFRSTARKGEFSAVNDNSPNCSGTSCEEALFDDCEKTCNMVNGAYLHSEIKDSELSSMLEFIDDDWSDGLIDVPLLMEDNIGGDYRQTFESYGSRNLQIHAANKQYNQSSRARVISRFSEGLGESGFTESGTQVNHVRQRIDKRISERHPNGKKNLKYLRLSRNTDSESFGDRADRSENSLKDTMHKDRLFVFSETKIGYNSCGESLNHVQFVKCEPVSDVGDVPQAQASKFTKLSCMNDVGSSFGRELEAARSVEAGNKLSNSLSYARGRGSANMVDVPISTIPLQQLFANYQVHLPAFSKHQVPKPSRSMSMDSLLFDVELNVQASYQGPHIPLVSFMSKLNGKAIVGHPISVEVLQDGAAAALVPRNVWCAPISNIDHSLKNRINIIGKSQPKESHLNIQGKKADHTKVKSPLMKKKSSKNKRSGFSPRKIRRLSSIAVDRKDKKEERQPMVEKIKGPAVACVPLRLVFSRINEALSCSARPANIS
ncbi:uncharacterized protein At1g51745 [Elaeis guineensis]|uniref:Uncharacterized protein At1g51745 n=1 Tax=Elaeis guineensis var. tenera TaxID=51953 RepID=A0A6I9REE0_ELAGV|nr:uncharacterized protein At1g51745 [Elaeis guineensis]XP_010924939.1 uncharacterized protein At1g51745 [Elaeis guineensis]XP_019707050.1 uncharacterized protein At1g51745 [Elaeis guineensis]